jgi:DOPA 4,5-dioxygenase
LAPRWGACIRSPSGRIRAGVVSFAFDSAQFDKLIPWLDENRGGLTVLVHGVTGNDLEDHTTHASWLGEPVELTLEVFR